MSAAIDTRVASPEEIERADREYWEFVRARAGNQAQNRVSQNVNQNINDLSSLWNTSFDMRQRESEANAQRAARFRREESERNFGQQQSLSDQEFRQTRTLQGDQFNQERDMENLRSYLSRRSKQRDLDAALAVFRGRR